jgi:hypothetical protein
MNRLRFTTAILLAALLCTGCKGMGADWSKHMPWAESEPQKEESHYQQPVRVVAIWSPAILNTPGKVPTRGFGGRLYFYNSNNEAIPVEGNLAVFAYDDTQAKLGSNEPDRRFAFTAEQFTQHFSETDIGASYSIWVPWDPVGNPRAEVSLLPIFTSTKGSRVAGQQSRNLLPGSNDPPPQTRIETVQNQPLLIRDERPPLAYSPLTNQPAAAPYGVQQTAYQGQPPAWQTAAAGAAGTNAVASPQTMQTMSINLPGSLADRLANAQPQALPAPRPPVAAQAAPRYGSAANQGPAVPPNWTEARAMTMQPSQGGSAMTSEARAWMGRAPRPWSPPDPRLTHFVRPRSPVPGMPNQQSTSDPLLLAPGPAGQPSPPPGTLQSGPLPAAPGAW